MSEGLKIRTEEFAALSRELERQADIYRGLGVPKDTIMSLLAPHPDWLPKSLNIPVVALGTSVYLEQQAEFAGIETDYELSSGYNTAGSITYREPHLIWMQDGSKYRDKSVEWVRNYLWKREAATQYDGVALAIGHPNIQKVLDDHFIDLPGTAVASIFAPFLGRFRGKLRLAFRPVTLAHPYWGSATCGS